MIERDISRRAFVGLTAVLPFGITAASGDWLDLFDGQSMTGWRPSERKSSWRVVEGALTADGPRSHLFYTGPVSHADFRNFELEVELTTQPDCNSGVCFHTAYQEAGFPEKGFEVQINNTARGDGRVPRTEENRFSVWAPEYIQANGSGRQSVGSAWQYMARAFRFE